MRRMLLIGISSIIISCSQPIEIKPKSEIIVVEGQISNLINRSFIKMYRLDSESTFTSIPGLDIKVIAESGQEYSFNSNDGSNLYLPSSGFAGSIGERYRMEAYGPDDLFFESTYDLLVEPVGFELMVRDTVVAIFNSLNVANFRNGTAAIAEIPAQENSTFLRINFKYSYIDFFTEQEIEVKSEDEFVLYDCNMAESCLKPNSIPVGVTTRDEWFFISSMIQPCDLELEEEDLDFIPICQSQSCCEYFPEWPTEFEIRVESMSKESFKYWKDVERLRNNNGLIFDTYPFPISGNISCENCDREVVGIFRTISESFDAKTVIL